MSSAGIFTDHIPTREEYLHRAITHFWRDKIDGMILLDGTVVKVPEKLHISVGFSYGAKQENKQTRGCCWERRASKDGVNHIFISPALDDTAQVLLTLGHEMIHAALDCTDGQGGYHGGWFAEIATRVGFDGKMTSSHASMDLAAELLTLADELGDYPHGQLMVGAPVLTPVTPGGELVIPSAWITTGGKAQTSRWMKVACPKLDDQHVTPTTRDGYHVRMTRGMLSTHGAVCAVCGDRIG